MNKVIADPQSIEIHSAQADYYKYRTPYVPQIFETICKELNITKETILMDVGCGRGEVANILSKYAGKIYAVDGSQEMIDLAIKNNNINYQVIDLNSENPFISKKVDHLFFGRSIHWFPAESLKRFSSDLLADDGKVVVCSTQWSPVGEWGQVYFQTKQKFSPKNQSAIHDFTGRVNLIEAGFAPIKRLAIDVNLSASIDFMIGHSFSTAYRENLINLKINSLEFAEKMKKNLAIFDEKKQIILKVTGWAIIYSKNKN